MTEFIDSPRMVVDKLSYKFLPGLNPELLARSASRQRTDAALIYTFEHMDKAVGGALRNLVKFNNADESVSPLHGGIAVWSLLEASVEKIRPRLLSSKMQLEPSDSLAVQLYSARRDLINTWRGVQTSGISYSSVEQSEIVLAKAGLDEPFSEAIQRLDIGDTEINEPNAKCGAAVVALTVGALLQTNILPQYHA